MFDMRIRAVMQKKRLLKAPPETVVAKAAKLMAKKNVGAVLVVKNERLIGIFTERDVVSRVVAGGLDARTTRLAEVMTRSPQTVGPEQTLGQALLIMHEKGFRHLPVVEQDKVIGIVSSRSAMDPDLEEFVSEAARRQYFIEKRDTA
jgi:CBS domain-containing protein